VKRAVIFGITLLAGLTVAEETSPRSESPASGQVLRCAGNTGWLGLDFNPMTEAVHAQVPDLLPGIGLVVTKVAPGSPAEKAGVKPHDIFWKLGDQWITNTAQLKTLLNIKKVGEEVSLGLYRSGQALTVPLVLGSQPNDQLLAGAPVKATMRPDVPVKIFYPAEGSGEIKAPDGKVTLSMVNGHAEVKIISSSGAIVFEGPVKDSQGVSLVPDAWKQRVSILERGLGENMNTARPPRTRAIPATEESGK
jgi:membrane-associated protease RseP (regulator of RpoE activity)